MMYQFMQWDLYHCISNDIQYYSLLTTKGLVIEEQTSDYFSSEIDSRRVWCVLNAFALTLFELAPYPWLDFDQCDFDISCEVCQAGGA